MKQQTKYIWNLVILPMLLISIGMLITGMGFSFASAQFISPIENQTYNTTIITLNYNLSEVPTDFYYIVNNNTDGTERVYPTENLSVEYFALEGINQVYVVYIINGSEYNDSIIFYVNTSQQSNGENTTTPSLTPPSSSHSSGGGGGSCMTKWECTNWSECASNNLQSRVCNYKANYCKPTSIKPNETQSCNYSPQDKTIGASGSIPDVSVMANSSVDKTVDTQTQDTEYITARNITIVGIFLVIVFGIIMYLLNKRSKEDIIQNENTN